VTGPGCHITEDRPNDGARECEIAIGDRKAREGDVSFSANAERVITDDISGPPTRHVLRAQVRLPPLRSRESEKPPNQPEGIAKRAGGWEDAKCAKLFE
jgi:hypothetical protein